MLIYKENTKGNSDCCEIFEYHEYHGLSNVYLSNSATTSGVNFTPKRITVTQMN